MSKPAVFEFEGAEYAYDESVLNDYDFCKAIAYIQTGDNKYEALFYDSIYERLFGDNFLEYWDALGGNIEKIAQLTMSIVAENRAAKN